MRVRVQARRAAFYRNKRQTQDEKTKRGGGVHSLEDQQHLA